MKTIITLILLLAAGGAVFFLGWAQYDVPAGSYGVLRSKTHGTSSELIKEGRLQWIWYKLIPSNVTIAVFSIHENSVSVDFSGILPSGNVYSALAGLKTNFPYSFSVSVSFKIKSESLPALAERANLLTQEDLDVYCSHLSEDIENHIRIMLWAYGKDEKILKEAQETGTIRGMERDLASVFPEVEIVSLSIKTVEFPDYALYNEVRLFYQAYLSAQRTDLRNEAGQLSMESIKKRRRLDELADYGELLSKYPILLQYLELEKRVPAADERR